MTLPPGSYPPAADPSAQPPQSPYGPPGPSAQPPYPAAPRRNNLVFVVSIIMIVGGALGGLLNLVALPLTASVLGGAAVAVVLFAVLVGVVQVVAGIMGVRFAAIPERAPLLVNLAIGLVTAAVIMLVLSLAVLQSAGAATVAGLLIPVLYLTGALQMKKQG